MGRTLRKFWNGFSWTVVGAVVLLALGLVGLRLAGFTPYAVLSGSMEPAFPTGSLIFVRHVDPFSLQSGDVITFMMDEDTVATHRIVEVLPDEEDEGVIWFRTKGDANNSADGSLVHYKNVIGTPQFAIPLLGRLAAWVSQPPGMYIGITALGMLMLLLFAPDMLRAADRADRAAEKKRSGSQDDF